MTDILIGSTDYTKTVYIPDPASTDGSGKTGLVAADLTVSYTRVETDNDVTVTDVTASLNDLAALTTAHTDWGLKEVSNTLAPGLYRLDIADAVFASGAWSAVVYVMITTSAAAASPIEFDLVAYNKLDGVRLGLTALPNAAADAAGGLPISDAGGLDLDARLDAAITSRLAPTTAGRTLDVSAGGEAGIDWANIGSPTTAVNLSGTTVKTATDVETDTADIQGRLPAALVSGRIDASVGAMAANTLTATAIAADAITAAKIADGAIDAATFASGAITADAIAADAIGSAELAASAVTEIQSGLSTLDAAGVRAAVGLASANLDTQIDGLPTANENADALLDRAAGVETNRTVRQAMRVMLGVLAGKASGLATTSVVYRDTNDTLDRVSATVDADGNRSSVTLNTA